MKMTQSFRILFQYVFKEALLYCLFSVVAAFIVPFNIIIIERMINNVQQNGPDGIYSYNSFLWLFILSATSFFIVWQDYRKRNLDIILEEKLTKSCAPVIIDKFNNIEYSYFENTIVQDVISLMGNGPMNAIINTFKNSIQMISLIIKLFGTAFIYFKLSFVLGFVLMGIIALQLYFSFQSQKEINKLYCSQTEEERKLVYLGELLCNKDSVYDLKINNARDFIYQLQAKKAHKILWERIKISIKAEKYYCVNLGLMILWTIMVIVNMVHQVSVQSISLSLFITLIGFFPAIISNSNHLSYLFSSIGNYLIITDAFHEFIHYPERIPKDDRKNTMNSYCEPVITFDHVCFTCPDTEKMVLNDISFRISPGEKVALVGANGSGKSTIVKLLVGLYQPTSGTIAINGVDINHIPNDIRNSMISAVFQDYMKYALTIRENVGLGNTSLINNDQQIYNALEKGNLKTFTLDLTKKLDTNLEHYEEDGISLSGGEWQRLAVSRACLSDSDFIILDEPTASMDPIAESKMYESFMKVIEDQGCLIISHRLASAKMADKILVLDQGRIVECGSHDELIQQNHIYKQMYDKQAQWY